MRMLGVGTLLAGILFSGEAWPWVQVTTVDDGYVLQWDQRALPARVVLRVGGRGADCLGRGSWEAYGPCLDDVIRHAADAWVQTGADIEIVSESEKSTEGCVSGDGVSTVTLGTDYCGNRWGDAVGITMYQTAWLSPGDWDFPDGRPIKITEVDIVFNTGNFPGRPGVPIRWASYNGPSRYSPIDIHRVALHEFGHFWGLAHPDDHGQTVPAIMNAGDYAYDRLQPDDVQGITTIYPQTNGLVQARVYAIPPITARDQAAVRIHCEGLDGEACTVHLDCTDPEGAEYAGPVPGTIPAFGSDPHRAGYRRDDGRRAVAGASDVRIAQQTRRYRAGMDTVGGRRVGQQHRGFQKFPVGVRGEHVAGRARVLDSVAHLVGRHQFAGPL